MGENEGLNMAAAGGLRAFESLREEGVRARARMNDLAEGTRTTTALGGEGERFQEVRHLSHTAEDLAREGEDMAAFDQRLEAVLKRFK